MRLCFLVSKPLTVRASEAVGAWLVLRCNLQKFCLTFTHEVTPWPPTLLCLAVIHVCHNTVSIILSSQEMCCRCCSARCVATSTETKCFVLCVLCCTLTVWLCDVFQVPEGFFFVQNVALLVISLWKKKDFEIKIIKKLYPAVVSVL